VAPGAIAAQQRYGVPASVTIAQAIEESNWGASALAADDHNLFGIKGTGPAGAARYPTQEFVNGQWETITASFRAYHNMAESISDHAELLATSGYYTRAMADRDFPDAFANDLTGIYATDPDYGTNLIALMRLYDLYKYNTAAPASQRVIPQSPPAAHSSPAAPGTGSAHKPSAPAVSANSAPSAPASSPADPAPAPKATSSAPRPGTSSQGSAHSSGGTSRGGAGGGARANIPGLVTASLVSARTPARYQTPLPAAVTTAYFTTAKTPLGRSEQLYRDVAGRCGISWKLLAAVDWMQCGASPRHSPVHGEKLGTVNPGGSVYGTRSEALAQCAADMTGLARAVYGIDLTVPRPMPVRTLAEVFAAFRWGGLLKKHGVSAMEFPYAVAGLTDAHARMHWPRIGGTSAPDKPGAKFRQPFGAVPVVLSLKYPATV
jgi:hypothetical protein